jgi:hypothetical protein
MLLLPNAKVENHLGLRCLIQHADVSVQGDEIVRTLAGWLNPKMIYLHGLRQKARTSDN